MNNQKKCMSYVLEHAQVDKQITLADLYDMVIGTEFSATIEQIRTHASSGKSSEANNLKCKLPGVTVSGTFKGRRKTSRLDRYSGLICLDIDKLYPQELVKIKEKAEQIHYTTMAFISPSGMGLKVIVKVDSEREQHKEAYKQVQDYYEEQLGCTCDNTHDVTRLCYVSYDRTAFYSERAETFPVKELPLNTRPKVEAHIDEEWADVFNEAIRYTNNKQAFEESNRNNYIHLLSANCNRYRIPYETALGFIVNKYEQDDFDAKEITNTVSNVYASYTTGHGKWYNSVKHLKGKKDRKQHHKHEPTNTNVVRTYKKLPVIPHKLTEMLPSLFSIKGQFNEQDHAIVFMTHLTLLSSMFDYVSGEYNGTTVSPNLNTLIIASPASGKSIISAIKSCYSKHLEGKEISTNVTAAALLAHLNTNSSGIICNSRADILASMNNRERTRFATVVNNSFHHKPFSTVHDADAQIGTYCPDLSILLGCLPNQVVDIVRSTRESMFSKFLYYIVDQDVAWKDVSSSNREYEASIREELNEINEYIAFLEHGITVSLTKDQWRLLNTTYTELLTTYKTVSEDMIAVVKRMGLITFKIAMILTVLNYFNYGVLKEDMECNDDDFAAALQLTGILLQHSVGVYELLNHVTEKVIVFNESRLLELLPAEFDRKTAIDLANNNGFKGSTRTIDNYLSKLLASGKLRKTKYNAYEKEPLRSVDISGREERSLAS